MPVIYGRIKSTNPKCDGMLIKYVPEPILGMTIELHPDIDELKHIKETRRRVYGHISHAEQHVLSKCFDIHSSAAREINYAVLDERPIPDEISKQMESAINTIDKIMIAAKAGLYTC